MDDIWVWVENPLKQLSQKVPKSMLVWIATLITNRSITRLNRDNFLNGEYIKVKANNKAMHGMIRERLVTAIVEALINAATKMR